MVELIGWVWTTCSVVKSIPQSYKCYQQKHFNGASGPALYIWLIGLITGFPYAFNLEGNVGPLIANFSINSICCLIQLYYYRLGNK